MNLLGSAWPFSGCSSRGSVPRRTRGFLVFPLVEEEPNPLAKDKVVGFEAEGRRVERGNQ